MKKPHWVHKFEVKSDCWVFVPDEDTIIRGREIKKLISSQWKPPYYYAHFKQGGHVSALKRHLENDLFIQTDIKQFFNQINKSKATRSLQNLLKDYELAREIASESVVPKPDSNPVSYILPFGFVQSPIIASLCLYNSALGKFINGLEGRGFKVSVYMDDIIISTTLPLDEAENMLETLKQKATRSSLELNPNKTTGPVAQISAFNINLSKNNLEITDQKLTDFENRLLNTKNEYVINGILGYIKTVCPNQVPKLAK